MVVGVALERGSMLTDAAMKAGFASPSHLSVAFRAMFGVRPSDLIETGTRFEIDRALPFGDQSSSNGMSA